MTTSSAEDIPRGVDFLFSLNRIALTALSQKICRDECQRIASGSIMTHRSFANAA
jgi:hypothetical protein